MTYEALAKVNMTLEVFGKRADGFHALRSVVLPIGLADTLTFLPADTFATDTGYPDDLILKAANVLAGQRSATNKQSFSIHVEKRIPAGGGLGGGSADAAVTLLALNELWHLDMTPEELADLGARIGSDVPALVLANHYHAPVRMEGRGEIVSRLTPPTLPCSNSHTLSLVLANPGVPCSTASVYRACTARKDDGGCILKEMCSALASHDLDRIAAAMMNDLQEPACTICPEVAATLAALREAGVARPMMSGSGSTVFGLAPTDDEAHRMVCKLVNRGLHAWSVTADAGNGRAVI